MRAIRTRLADGLRRAGRLLRRLSGDDAYERYLAHHATRHPDVVPLTRAAFFRQWQDDRWQGVRRCC